MPRRKTKKFIDKKNAVTFHLVHRSQKDPLVADETAPQRVLVPAVNPQTAKIEKRTSIENKKRKEEQQKYGIYYDDDYNYLQHLRDVNSLSVEWQRVENTNSKQNKDNPKINLPSSVFASNVEEKVGLLNKAAPITGPRLDLDPDVVAAMDDDFDYDDPENQLEDNFMELANAEMDDKMEDGENEYKLSKSDKFDDDSSESHMNLSDEEMDEVGSLNESQYTFEDETKQTTKSIKSTKSRFTEYSMSSSVVRRNEQLKLLDDKFEQMYASYDDNEIGALDCDEIEGHIAHDSDLVMQCVEEFEKKQREDIENMAELMKDRIKIIEKEWLESDDDLEEIVVDAREKNKWDCQSFASAHKTYYNKPKLIPSDPKLPKKIKIDRKTGVPKDVLGNTGKLTAAALAQFDLQNEVPKSSQSVAESRRSTLSMLSIRPKGETPEEKKQRKSLLKNYRRERRIEKKANSEAFKEEKKRQEKIILNNRQNIQGNRLL